MRRSAVTTIIAVAALAAAWVLPALAARPPEAGKQARSPLTFVIEGDVEYLYPGVPVTAAVDVVNSSAVSLEVIEVTVEVGDGPGSCHGSLVEVEPFTGSVIVPAVSTGQVEMTFTMVADAPNDCQGVTFPITYSGTATKG